MSDCKGRARKTCKKNCFFTNGVQRKYCRTRTGKRRCRGRELDRCYQENKCKVAQGDSRRFCRKTHNTKSASKSSWPF